MMPPSKNTFGKRYKPAGRLPGMASKPPRQKSALIVGKGEADGKLDQGSDDDDPGGNDHQPEQGLDDEAVLGKALQASPGPGQGPGQLLGEQEEEPQKTGIKKYGADEVIPEAPDLMLRD